MKYLLPLISTVLLFAACSKSENDEPLDPMAQRTVMVYMSGDNDLSAYAQDDINEMKAAANQIPNRNNLLVFVDRKSGKEKPFIAKITNNQNQPVDTLYKFTSDFYASDPEQFTAVLQRMTTLAPAHEYALVLWGHACGWAVSTDTIAQTRSASRVPRRAYGLDDYKWMNITQMAKALKSLPKMKYIFADCCNMMCAEVAYELRDATEYLIGSPAEIPGNGAPYDKVMPHLFKSDANMYKGIIDAYFDYYLQAFKSSYLNGYSVPLSVVDTRYIMDLCAKTRDAIDQTTGGYPQCPDSPDFSGIAFYWGYDAPLMYDMRAVINRLAPADVFKQWESSFQQAVPYYRMSMKWMTIYDGSSGSYNLVAAFDTFDDKLPYGCVSMYLPKEGKGYTYGDFQYNKYANNFEWNNVMNWSRYGW